MKNITFKYRGADGIDEFGTTVIDHAVRNGVTTVDGLVENYFGDREKAEGELRILESKGFVKGEELYRQPGLNNLGQYLALALIAKGSC